MARKGGGSEGSRNRAADWLRPALCLLYIPFYTRLQIFIQLSPTVTKLQYAILSATTQRAFRPTVDILSV